MENYEKFEQLLQQYSFNELSAEDRYVVERFVHSEEEYESLRQAGHQLNFYFSKSELSPDRQVWRRIKKTWEENSTHDRRNHWLSTPLPSYVTLLLVIGIGSLCWVGGSRYTSVDQISVKQPTPHVDTVFITSKPDTVVRERVIYVERKSQGMPALQVTSKGLPDRSQSKGVNMKEKEELEKLLVSGSM